MENKVLKSVDYKVKEDEFGVIKVVYTDAETNRDIGACGKLSLYGTKAKAELELCNILGIEVKKKGKKKEEA